MNEKQRVSLSTKVVEGPKILVVLDGAKAGPENFSAVEKPQAPRWTKAKVASVYPAMLEYMSDCHSEHDQIAQEVSEVQAWK